MVSDRGAWNWLLWCSPARHLTHSWNLKVHFYKGTGTWLHILWAGISGGRMSSVVGELGGFLSQWAASCCRVWQERRFEGKVEASKETKALPHLLLPPNGNWRSEIFCHNLFSLLLKWLICFRSQFIGYRHKVIGNLVKLKSALCCNTFLCFWRHITCRLYTIFSQ